jgi:hypothetical protein
MGSKSGIDGVLDVAVVSGGGDGGGGGAVTAAAGAFVDGAMATIGATTDAASTTPAAAGSLMSFLKGAVSQLALLVSGIFTPYRTPDSRNVVVASNMAILFSDDFASAAGSAANWTVLDGGLGANPNLGNGELVQAAIGSGVAMGNGVNALTNSAITFANSSIVVEMGTTANAELWLLSTRTFAGTEDVLATFSKSQALVTDSMMIGLVEVDPTTGVPMMNATAPSYTIGGSTIPAAFTNLGGVELGCQTVATAYVAVAIGDSSPNVAQGAAGATLATMINTPSEFVLEFHAEDLIVSNGAVDSAAAKGPTPSRVSSQAADDSKVYKLLIRFRNTDPATGTTASIGRAVVVDTQELRVEVASGRGDQNAQKAVAVNVAGGNVSLVGATNGVYLSKNGIQGNAITTFNRLTGAAATGEIKASSGILYSYDLLNTNAAVRYLQFYGSPSTTFGSQGTPVLTVGIPPGGKAMFDSDIGWLLGGTGMSWAITTDAPGTTEGAAADITGWLSFL